MRRWLTGPVRRAAPRSRPGPASQRIAWAVTASARRLPGRSSCLAQALAAHVLLRRAGLPAVLRIGVARPAEGPFHAHAWVESDGQVLLGGPAAGTLHPLPPLPDPS